MSPRITKTGELRQFLCDAILAVKNGDMKPETAARITKLAAQVTESIYAEVKVQRTMREAGEEATALGELHVGMEP